MAPLIDDGSISGKVRMNNLIVYKSNSLIQAGYKLSVNEQRIILNCIGQINSAEEVTDEVMYQVSVHEIAQQSGLDPNSIYKDVKESAIRLAHRKVSIPKPTNSAKDRIILTSWVQTIAYSDSEATVELRFSKDILPYLTQLKEQFTKYKLKHVAKMKSSYGIRLYELLMQYKQFGSRDIEITWLREQFQLNQKEYPRMYDFKKRIINPAVEDINKASDLWVKYHQRKRGRHITHLTFEFGFKSTPKTKSEKLTRKYIEQNSFPGESWKNAKKRLSEEVV
ncbi:MAG: RepB family plasmid replication initiator protein [Bacteroidetes bacterium]|nr:RepB family plasmid replication initiator protein [Bacteroidota bacterium]